MNGYDPHDVVSLYDQDYAAVYEDRYRIPWPDKHDVNKANLQRILSGLMNGPPHWLDTCCGQAWHFSLFPDTILKTGIDLSADQLQLAAQRNPGADFVQGDVVDYPFEPDSFDLVTNFWASYCYLNGLERIRWFLYRVIRWTRPGGALYFEILRPEDLESFNDSTFARTTGFRVYARSPDYSHWGYEDMAGHHTMFSPPLSFFLEVLHPHYAYVDTRHDKQFMTHLIATHRM